ncbi:MAG: spore germination protein, partial [Cellulosilyticaceae bacterium]
MTKLTPNLDHNLNLLKQTLPVGKSFDMIEKILDIHGKKFYLFFIDGFAKDTNLEYIRRDIYALKDEDFKSIHSAKDLIQKAISSIEVSETDDVDTITTAILSGQTAILFDMADSAVIVDLRSYPTRSMNEPEKEKALRGSKDGFVETIVFNTALVRRRIRDTHLVFEMVNIGSISKTDVAIGYLSDKVNKKSLAKLKELIDKLDVDDLTTGDQSFIEAIHASSWINPFPKVRYTERPDIASAQLAEGNIIVIIDNTPSVMILPTSIFDFLQDVNDYYMPVLTGNYLRFVRTVILFVNLFLTPVYVLLVRNQQWIPYYLEFILPQDPPNIPLFIQFLALEM